MKRILLISVVIYMFHAPGVGAQTPDTPPATAEPAAVQTQQTGSTPTDTPVSTPTATPVPTNTAVPTSMPAATATPTPTATPAPAHTPAPTATATLTGQNQEPPTETPAATLTATMTPMSTATPTFTPTPTRTVTPLWPTDTPTPTATWTATPACVDDGEPNGYVGQGAALIINQTLSDLTFYPDGDVDYYALWGKGGKFYQITTATSEGVDTRLRIFDPAGQLIAENDDYTPGNPASRVTFMAPGEGWFAVGVDSRAPIQWGCRHYTLTVVDVSPPTATPTATPGPSPTATRTPTTTPTATAIPGEVMYDDYEPNPSFEWAANVGVNQTLNLNFNPYPAGSNEVDNDFFRLYVKVGDVLRFETSGLAEGLDTNLILYRDNGQVVAGNDDCQPGQRRSCLEWPVDYTGIAYVLAGPVGTIPEAIAAGARAYSLVIKNVAGQVVTPLPGSTSSAADSRTPQFGQELPWAVTPLPPTATPPAAEAGQSGAGSTNSLGSTPTPAVVVRPFSLAPPAATPKPLQAMTAQITVYYDENNNRAPDTNEGVAGLSVRVLDSVTNQVLGQTFTDIYGHAILAVSAPAEVRLSVPYLSYNQLIKPPGKELSVRLTPLRLPSLIP
jgi:hypothetical protein